MLCEFVRRCGERMKVRAHAVDILTGISENVLANNPPFDGHVACLGPFYHSNQAIQSLLSVKPTNIENPERLICWPFLSFCHYGVNFLRVDRVGRGIWHVNQLLLRDAKSFEFCHELMRDAQSTIISVLIGDELVWRTNRLANPALIDQVLRGESFDTELAQRGHDRVEGGNLKIDHCVHRHEHTDCLFDLAVLVPLWNAAPKIVSAEFGSIFVGIQCRVLKESDCGKKTFELGRDQSSVAANQEQVDVAAGSFKNAGIVECYLFNTSEFRDRQKEPYVVDFLVGVKRWHDG